MRRLLNLLPPGTVAVGAGLAVLGVSAYVHLAVAGHSLDPAGMSAVSVFWAIVFTVGPGLFLPFEQEIARLVAAQRAHGPVDRVLVLRAWKGTAGLLAVLLAVTVLAAGPIADKLFNGDTTMVWLLCGALTGLALSHATRGVLAGFGRFGRYGVQIAVDGVLRMVLAVAFALAGLDSAAWFSAVLVIAPIAAVLLTLPDLTECTGTGPGVSWGVFSRGLATLTVSALLAQVVVNIGVINVKLLAPDDVLVAGALLSALVLVRVPLFVFASLQASLLPGLAAAYSHGDEPGYRRLLLRSFGLVTVLGVLGGIVTTLLGPWLIGLLFDAPDVLTHADFGWLAAGTLAYLWAMVLGQGLLARGRHAAQAVSWVVGLVALVAVTLLPGGTAQRVELGYLAGSLTVAVVMAVLLAVRARAAATTSPALEAALADLPRTEAELT